jgi:hypothetical protein
VCYGGVGGRDYDGEDHVRSVATIVPHELERDDEEGKEQMAKQELLQEENEHERRTRRVDLGRLSLRAWV